MSKINLFGIDFEVVLLNEKQLRGSLGYISHDHCQIEINESLPVQIQKRTLLHEIIHEVLTHTGLYEIFKSKRIDIEMVTEMLSGALYNIIKSNPGIFQMNIFDVPSTAQGK